VVTDHGGILSHPALVAREYGIPAVVGTKLATTRLRDGQMVSVDGSTGRVELVGQPKRRSQPHSAVGTHVNDPRNQP